MPAMTSSQVRILGLASTEVAGQRCRPEGAKGLSPGFQPWETCSVKRGALKGREELVPDVAFIESDPISFQEMCETRPGMSSCAVELLIYRPFSER